MFLRPSHWTKNWMCEIEAQSFAWSLILLVTVLGILRQKDYYEFKTSLGSKGKGKKKKKPLTTQTQTFLRVFRPDSLPLLPCLEKVYVYSKKMPFPIMPEVLFWKQETLSGFGPSGG